MRGKRANQIQRIANAITVGMDNVKYIKFTYHTKMQINQINGSPLYYEVISPIRLAFCTRKVAKDIKRKFKNGFDINTSIEVKQ